MNTYEKYINARVKNKSILCLGLDTSLDKLPEHLPQNTTGMLDFNRRIIESTQDYVCAYKINFAFYEEFGVEGFDILKKTIETIPSDIVIIADAKRGDIGNTSLSYAKAVFEYFKTDSITVNAYMGYDCVEPFLSFKDKLIFILALTSNKGAFDFQHLITDSKPLFRHVIEKAMNWGSKENVGFVVGATQAKFLADIRSYCDYPLLIPGIGTQGGSISETMNANRNYPAIINVSRDIIYASSGTDFDLRAAEKAAYYKNLLIHP
ncbi:MAG: orotidine-5'-phosphate decarboxylase [Candidatus Kapabacteria bacterium]|nr:orotidine-5'-phosphate decarboxylase [Candidatus Kapabacteria bacterium]